MLLAYIPERLRSLHPSELHKCDLKLCVVAWVQLRSLAASKKNKAEGTKAKKGGHKMWTEVTELAELIR